MARCEEAWPLGMMPHRCSLAEQPIILHRIFIQRVKSPFSSGTSERNRMESLPQLDSRCEAPEARSPEFSTGWEWYGKIPTPVKFAAALP